MPPVTRRSLRPALAQKQRLLGTFITLADPTLAELLAGAFDLLIIDLEHSPLSARDAQQLTIAAHAADAWILARVPSVHSDMLTVLLDAGLDGVVVPRVSTVADVQYVASALCYPPQGHRHYGPRRANAHGRRPDYWRAARDQFACLIQIETRGALDAVTEIAATPGIDALLIGPADLSFDLGVPLQHTTAVMRNAIEQTLAAAHAAGISCALASNTPPDQLAELVDDRCTLLVQSVDVRIYAHAADSTADAARAALRNLHQPST